MDNFPGRLNNFLVTFHLYTNFVEYGTCKKLSFYVTVEFTTGNSAIDGRLGTLVDDLKTQPPWWSQSPVSTGMAFAFFCRPPPAASAEGAGREWCGGI
jgi:hypothetical protein